MDVFDCRPAPHPKRNRRRERPGSRTRRTHYRKEGLHVDFAEDVDLALSSSKLPPFDYTKPSPLRRQTFDQSWQRWKAREAEEKAAVVQKENHELLAEQHRLFGGEVNDDELRAMGLLYNGNEDSLSGSTMEDVLPQPIEYAFRTRFRGGSRRRSTRLELPLFLSSSFLSHDADILRLMGSFPNITTIQHRNTDSTFPQSLPPSTRESEASVYSSPLLFPLAGDDEDLADSTWSIISSLPSTPPSEPETWIHLSDDL